MCCLGCALRMNYNRAKNEFYEIDYSNKVLFYTDDNKPDIQMSKLLEINLTNPLLYNVLSKRYGFSHTPIMLLYKQLIEPEKEAIAEVENGIEGYLESEYEVLIKSAQIVIFIKGDIAKPYCKFSKMLVSTLKKYIANFEDVVYYDVFMNEEMREAVKTYSGLYTYPQLYVNGKLVGGSDAVAKLDKSGELQQMINKTI